MAETADDLLFRLFVHLTCQMSDAYMLKSEFEEPVDERRVMDAKQIELLENLEPKWAEKQKNILEEFLEEIPYDDRTLQQIRENNSKNREARHKQQEIEKQKKRELRKKRKIEKIEKRELLKKQKNEDKVNNSLK